MCYVNGRLCRDCRGAPRGLRAGCTCCVRRTLPPRLPTSPPPSLLRSGRMVPVLTVPSYCESGALQRPSAARMLCAPRIVK